MACKYFLYHSTVKLLSIRTHDPLIDISEKRLYFPDFRCILITYFFKTYYSLAMMGLRTATERLSCP